MLKYIRELRAEAIKRNIRLLELEVTPNGFNNLLLETPNLDYTESTLEPFNLKFHDIIIRKGKKKCTCGVGE
jgi:hypothetical protein